MHNTSNMALFLDRRTAVKYRLGRGPLPLDGAKKKSAAGRDDGVRIATKACKLEHSPGDCPSNTY